MKASDKAISILRIAMGGLFFYSGITKVTNPEWTAAGYLQGAKTFSGLFQWFGSAQNIGWVDFLNQWGLTLIGVALMVGAFVRLASFFGILLMLLYYLPILSFPYVAERSYIVDDHIIYILVLVVFKKVGAGKYWGLDPWLKKQGWMKSLGLARWV